MALAHPKADCAVCGDRFVSYYEDCCGRCQRIVCRACSFPRGLSHESVLCVECHGAPKPKGVRRLGLFRRLKRLLLGRR
ncbi:MAG TPA: hypothetical protein VFU47_10745 [Armatimonadota bacterium]|nr:hypothetical protein [Armatimonadota bacterium]